MKRRPVSHCRSPAARGRETTPATGERILTLTNGWSAVDAVPHVKSIRFLQHEILETRYLFGTQCLLEKFYGNWPVIIFCLTDSQSGEDGVIILGCSRSKDWAVCLPTTLVASRAL